MKEAEAYSNKRRLSMSIYFIAPIGALLMSAYF